jgi:hypothetical protein
VPEVERVGVPVDNDSAGVGNSVLLQYRNEPLLSGHLDILFKVRPERILLSMFAVHQTIDAAAESGKILCFVCM